MADLCQDSELQAKLSEERLGAPRLAGRTDSKLLFVWCRDVQTPPAQIKKVFCFFSSEKKRFLTLLLLSLHPSAAR
jgi:hypothetical protein